MAHLDLKLPAGKSAWGFKVPEGQVAQVTLDYKSKFNMLCSISMVDRWGNTLFKTWDSEYADATHTIWLEAGE